MLFWLVSGLVDRFWMDIGVQNGAKIEEKSIKKLIKILNRFFIDLGVDFGAQDGPKIDLKGVRRRRQKTYKK